MPTVFIETNIRSVFIHTFFANKKRVTDLDIRNLIEKTLDRKNPREWYYALMDYGSFLKKTENHSKKSAQYAKQSPFAGSNRELRAKIVRFVLEKPHATAKDLSKTLKSPLKNIELNVDNLIHEGFLRKMRTKLTVK
ncbi:hypothetical protein KW783_02930 [Candidatus Parcubacteria bacterium]|nr:hypothetical protein [Candidatus Parcubacteria bacterium]